MREPYVVVRMRGKVSDYVGLGVPFVPYPHLAQVWTRREEAIGAASALAWSDEESRFAVVGLHSRKHYCER